MFVQQFKVSILSKLPLPFVFVCRIQPFRCRSFKTSREQWSCSLHAKAQQRILMKLPNVNTSFGILNLYLNLVSLTGPGHKICLTDHQKNVCQLWGMFCKIGMKLDCVWWRSLIFYGVYVEFLMFSGEVLALPTPLSDTQHTVLINLILMFSIRMGNAVEIAFLCLF